MDKPRTALKRTCCTPFPARLETSENRDLHTCMCLCVCSHACMYVCMCVIYWHLPKAWDALPSVNIQKLNKLLLEGWANTGWKEKVGVEYQNIKKSLAKEEETWMLQASSHSGTRWTGNSVTTTGCSLVMISQRSARTCTLCFQSLQPEPSTLRILVELPMSQPRTSFWHNLKHISPCLQQPDCPDSPGDTQSAWLQML